MTTHYFHTEIEETSGRVLGLYVGLDCSIRSEAGGMFDIEFDGIADVTLEAVNGEERDGTDGWTGEEELATYMPEVFAALIEEAPAEIWDARYEIELADRS